MGGECVSCGGLALLHLIVGSRGWLCGWLYQMMLTRKASPLSVEDKLGNDLNLVSMFCSVSIMGKIQVHFSFTLDKA